MFNTFCRTVSYVFASSGFSRTGTDLEVLLWSGDSFSLTPKSLSQVRLPPPLQHGNALVAATQCESAAGSLPRNYFRGASYSIPLKAPNKRAPFNVPFRAVAVVCLEPSIPLDRLLLPPLSVILFAHSRIIYTD